MAPLSEGDLQDIHLASLEVLERTGMWVEADDAIDVFARRRLPSRPRHAASVRIPPDVVEDAIRSAPPLIRWCGRDPGNDIVLGGGRLRLHELRRGDHGQRSARPARTARRATADVADICTVVDWASEIDVYEAAITPRDCPRRASPPFITWPRHCRT